MKSTRRGDFQCDISAERIVFHKLEFDATLGFPWVLCIILIDKDLHVKLECNCGSPIPLSSWITQSKYARLTHFSMLENLLNYISNISSCHTSSFLEEMKQQKYYDPRSRKSYSAAMFRFALPLRYISLQAHEVISEMFPLHSLSLLRRMQAGGILTIKSATQLRYDLIDEISPCE